MNHHFGTKVIDRIDSHFLTTVARKNKEKLLNPYTDINTAQILLYSIGNWFIKFPGFPLILLHVILCESIEALRFKKQEQTAAILDWDGNIGLKVWDMDYAGITDVSSRVSKWLSVKITPHLHTHSD